MGEIHMMAVTIFMMTSSMTAKNSITPAAFFPTAPRTTPKAMQKKMIPSILVEFLHYKLRPVRVSSAAYRRAVPVLQRIGVTFWVMFSGSLDEHCIVN